MRARRDGDQAGSDVAARRLAELTADLGRSEAAEPWWTDHAGPAAPPAPVAPADPADPAEPADWPRVGRHAARRSVTRALPALGPAQLAVVALVVAAGLVAAAWLVVRDRPAEGTAAPPPPPASAAPLLPLTSATGSTTPVASGEVTIDVTGRVRRPGIVVLDQGARVVDALEAAGGARAGVDLSTLNLARLLVDGEQIVVGAPPSTAVPPPTGAVPGGPTALVNINLATEAELDGLPEVGPVTAAAIVAWREEHGGFSAIDELLEVDGIGDATLEQLTPYVTV